MRPVMYAASHDFSYRRDVCPCCFSVIILARSVLFELQHAICGSHGSLHCVMRINAITIWCAWQHKLSGIHPTQMIFFLISLT